MTPIGHVMILASAGSGKTYALTNRFVRLLALGAAPERIVALTFTRKAAGEFFDEILKKLARAAREPAYAEQLAREIGCAQRTPDFLKMLRAVADAMHRLRLGTFDGFFARVAQNFPLELGLTGQFELLEEHAARMERQRVLRRMFERTGALEAAQREFIEAFKRATFGAEEKRLGAQLDAFLDEHQEVFLGAPLRELWGNARRIWREGVRWFDPAADVRGAAATLDAWAETAPIADKQRTRWREFIEAWAAWAPGIVPTRALVYVLEKALDAWTELEAGRAVLEFDRKKQELSAEACAALATLTRHVVGGELARRLETTAGIHAVLSAYEAVYHETVRRAGKLTFSDVQRLLLPEAGAPLLGRASEDDRRLAIDYRLDGEIDHWLLDEFQDTSFGQWSVLRNLIDEAVQDPTGARSFFYVGDVKQAIFAWREGDPRLFREIFDSYNALRPGTITEEHLVKSWRSGSPVIAAVNRVFGDAPVLNELFPGEASRAWNHEWRAHESARPEIGGQVALLHAEGNGLGRADDEAARFSVVRALLEEIQPLQRGLSCALLVQKNSTASALADYLRREGGWPAVAESDLHVCTDNPLGSALLALAKVAAHPGDTLAWQHVQMTPLRDALAAEGLVAREQVTQRLLAQIHAEGFERTMTGWARRLEPALAADDAFTRERARQFGAAASRFDETGSRDVAEFIAFMERHTVRDVESLDVLRVMTIHKSKGLGFDVVILPDLEGQKLDCRRDGLAVQRAADRTVEWVLDLPTKLFCACDEVLARHVTAAESDSCYEALSLLYVAMTRAKRAMYLVTKPPGSSTSRNFPKLLAETLGNETMTVKVGGREFAGAYADGDAGWHLPLAPVPPVQGAAGAGPTLVAIDAAVVRSAPRLPARLPSSVKAAELSGAQLFSAERTESAGFGIAVHALLADVEWADPARLRIVRQGWQQRGAAPEVIVEAEACVIAPELAAVWQQVEGAEVWRERPFEVVLEGAWITGVFDRVVVQRDADGRAVRAIVFDFKTDRTSGNLEPLRRRHAPQLNLYRQVAAVLTGLPVTAVDCQLVFTRLRRLAQVDAGEAGRPGVED